jgi:hypothetical protein
MTKWHTSYELKIKGSENLLVHRPRLLQKCYDIGRGGDRGARPPYESEISTDFFIQINFENLTLLPPLTFKKSTSWLHP